jgi:hypothetical protein
VTGNYRRRSLMSLFSTIAHDGPIPARGVRPNGIRMMAAGLTLAASVGLVIVNNTGTEPGPTTRIASRMAHDEFVRLNTTALDGLTPAAVIVESQKVVDPFIYINTTALEYSFARYSEQSTGPR